MSVPDEAEEAWGLQHGSEVYVMAESSAREHPNADLQLVCKKGGEWHACK